MSISKKLLVAGVSAAAILVASNAAFAKTNYKGDFKGEVAAPAPAPVVADKGLMGGFYLGAGLGYDVNRNSISGAIAGLNQSETIGSSGVSGKIFGGYGQYFDNWYLGTEAFFGLTNAKNGSTDLDFGAGTSLSTKVEAKNSYGISLIPGYKFTPSTLTFVRVGWTSERVDFTRALVSPVFNETITGSGRVNGLTLGVGMETQVYDNWSLRGEFDHTEFRTQSARFDAADSVSFKPKTNQAMLSVIYHFA